MLLPLQEIICTCTTCFFFVFFVLHDVGECVEHKISNKTIQSDGSNPYNILLPQYKIYNRTQWREHVGDNECVFQAQRATMLQRGIRCNIA